MELICLLARKEAWLTKMIHRLDFLSRDWHKLKQAAWTVVVVIVEIRHRENLVVPRPLAAIMKPITNEDAPETPGVKLGFGLGGLWLR